MSNHCYNFGIALYILEGPQEAINGSENRAGETDRENETGAGMRPAATHKHPQHQPCQSVAITSQQSRQHRPQPHGPGPAVDWLPAVPHRVLACMWECGNVPVPSVTSHAGFGWLRRPARLLLVLGYSLVMVSSRGHYTVDVVLAWWCLIAVGRLLRRNTEGNK